MFAKLSAKLLVRLLKSGRLDVDTANLCTEVLLDKLGALPFRDILYSDERGLIVRGKVIDLDTAVKLRESAGVALDNRALNLVREQVAFAAVTHGVHKAETPAQMFFARAVLWWDRQVQEKLLELAQRQELPLLED